MANIFACVRMHSRIFFSLYIYLDSCCSHWILVNWILGNLISSLCEKTRTFFDNSISKIYLNRLFSYFLAFFSFFLSWPTKFNPLITHSLTFFSFSQTDSCACLCQRTETPIWRVSQWTDPNQMRSWCWTIERADLSLDLEHIRKRNLNGMGFVYSERHYLYCHISSGKFARLRHLGLCCTEYYRSPEWTLHFQCCTCWWVLIHFI